MNLPTSITSGLPSCTKTVTVRMNGQVIQLKQNHQVVVNGQDITKIPYAIDGIKIRSVSSIFLQSKSNTQFLIYKDPKSNSFYMNFVIPYFLIPSQTAKRY